MSFPQGFFIAMQNSTQNEAKNNRHRVITFLDRKELEFLDKLGKDALFSTGHKLCYTEILRGLIDFAIEAGLSGKDIKSQEALKEEMVKKLAEKLEDLEKKQDNPGGLE